MVYAKCICGNVKEYRLRYIKTGHTRSCGCINKIHGFTKHPLFKVWQSMKERCYNLNHARYKDYGGRGITICNKWINDVAAFFRWGIKNGWAKGLEIDRRNNNKGYSPANCQIVAPKINMRNRKNSFKVKYKGVTKPLMEWAEELKLPASTLRQRIKNSGWDAERAFTQPIKIKKH